MVSEKYSRMLSRVLGGTPNRWVVNPMPVIILSKNSLPGALKTPSRGPRIDDFTHFYDPGALTFAHRGPQIVSRGPQTQHFSPQGP